MSLCGVDLSAAYGGRRIFSNVDVRCVPGELQGLVGPNGAGKSSLLRMLAGQTRPAAGRVTVDGEDPHLLPRREVARRIAFVPQGGRPAFPCTTEEFISYGLFARGDSAGDEADRLVAQALLKAGLSRFRIAKVDTLSGGEFGRALIAQALLQNARYLLLDEPVRDLDPGRQLETLASLRKAAHEEGRGVVVVLHDLALASRFCDRIVVLADGRRVADGPPDLALAPDVLRAAYGIEAARAPCPEPGRFWIFPKRLLTAEESNGVLPCSD